MSIGFISLLLGIALVAAIAISFAKKINAGMLAFAFAIIIAIVTGTNFNTILGGFPTKVVMAMFTITFLFGFLTENGTEEWLAKKLMHLTSRIPKAVPYAIFFVALLLGATGGANTLFFAVTLAMPIGVAYGMSVWEVGAICVLGSNGGSYAPISLHGTTARSLIEVADNGVWADSAMTINWYIFFTAIIVYLVAITIYYFAFKNYKIQAVGTVEKPPKATSDQKLCLYIILIMVILMVVPFLLSKMFPANGTIKFILKYCDITLLATLGIVFLSLLGKGNTSEIIKKRVPWNTIVLIFGMGMLINLAAELGVLDFLVEYLKAMPTWLVVPAFLFFAGVMSLFSSSLSVVYPTLIPIASGMCLANSNINPVAIFAGIVIGAATAAMSPMSMSGAFVMAGVPEETCSGDKLFKNLLIMAFVSLGILVVCAFVGLFGLFSI